MYKLDKTLREDKNRQERKNPSFSSSLLDEIYRSTDDGATKSPDLKFYREPINKKQSKSSGRTNKCIGEEEQMSSLQRPRFIDKWMMDNKASKKANVKQRQILNDREMKLFLDHDHDHDSLLFSSNSSSSDSSSGGFFSSDTDSLYGTRSRPKPVRIQQGGVKKTEGPLFHEQRDMHTLDDYQNHYSSTTEHTPMSMALKIYSNLKKMKQQPISPGGRLANFINSLFTTGNKFNNAKKTKNSSSVNASYDDVKSVMMRRSSKSGQVSTCSSASSFSSRPCLSKNSPSARERLSNGAKRSVRFYPVSVIVDEDCRPCGHKCLYDKDYKLIQKENDVIMRDFSVNYDHNDDDDDAASCSSSDLFELDHLNVNRYCEELPVYETTRVDTNRAIANSLRM